MDAASAVRSLSTKSQSHSYGPGHWGRACEYESRTGEPRVTPERNAGRLETRRARRTRRKQESSPQISAVPAPSAFQKWSKVEGLRLNVGGMVTAKCQVNFGCCDLNSQTGICATGQFSLEKPQLVRTAGPYEGSINDCCTPAQ